MRKPEARIYQHVLQSEGFSAHDAVFLTITPIILKGLTG
jgi:FMN phosphatase YigB (HAD superfamily)